MINGENQKAGEGVGMEMAPTEKCGATICFGDDFMDNECTFHCGLGTGHTGKHVETGVMGGLDTPMPFKLEWEGDARKEDTDGA